MKNLRTLLLIAGVIAVLAVIKLLFLNPKKTQGPGPGGPGKDQPAAVTVHVVKPGRLENKLFATGTVIANEEAELRPEMAGRIVQILFKEGTRVNKGELLVKINDADLQAQAKKLEVQLKLAEEKEARQKKLLDAGGSSQEEYDAALTSLHSLQADMDLVKAQIAKTQILAPFTGIIGLKNISEGSYVSSSTSIASIQQTDPVKIDFSVPEKYAGLLHRGDSIRFSVQGSPGTFHAIVYAVEPKIDPNTRSLQLRALCPNKKGNLFPGSFAKIEMELAASENSILIPTEALIPELKGQKVFVSRNGHAQPQKVETGLRTDTQVEIVSGLQAGDTVITTGIMQLKPDARLKIVH